MFWLTVVLAVYKLLYTSALECYHMNKYGVSKLITCRGYCASISAVVSSSIANNDLAKVNYCVPEQRCLAELDARQLSDIGSNLCRGLIESATGAISGCKAAVCQSDGCNDYKFKSDPEKNDCNLHMCRNARCHNPEELLTTGAPLGSSTYGTITTGPTTPSITGYQENVSAEPEPTSPGSERATERVIGEFETTAATTSGNEVTTKDPVVTTDTEVETEKPSTENTPSSSVTPSEKPAPVPREQTDPPKVETPAATTIKTEPVVTSDTPTLSNKEITESEEEEPTTEGSVTLDDFDTKTRGPPLVPTDFKETETSTTLLPTVAEVTTDGGVTSEVVFESTEYGEVVTIDFDSVVTTEDQRTTEVVDITRTPNRSKFFNNNISDKPPKNKMNKQFVENNSIDVEFIEITNREKKVVRPESNTAGASTSYLSLSLIFLVSAVFL